jgi:phage shock protein A
MPLVCAQCAGLPATDEELERKMEELEAKVRRLQDEEQLLKQMLSSALTRSQLENRLSFYKFSGTLDKSHKRLSL